MQFGTKFSLAVAILASCSVMSSANGQEVVGTGYKQQLFGNHYTQGYANQATARMYLAPVPVPAWVGHTYYTYEPLYPHEMMYRHARRYHNYYDNGHGLNRTKVRYSTAPLMTSAMMMMKSFEIPTRY